MIIINWATKFRKSKKRPNPFYPVWPIRNTRKPEIRPTR